MFTKINFVTKGYSQASGPVAHEAPGPIKLSFLTGITGNRTTFEVLVGF